MSESYFTTDSTDPVSSMTVSMETDSMETSTPSPTPVTTIPGSMSTPWSTPLMTTPGLVVEMEHDFSLWIGVTVVCAGLLFISLLFISIVLLYKHHTRKNSMRYVYQTKPKKKKRKSSAFSIRSQGILELQSPYPNNMEQLPTDQETSYAEEDDHQTHSTGMYDQVNSSPGRQDVLRQSIRSDSGRGTHFTRQSGSRMSVRSESGIGSRIHHHDGGDEYDGEGRARRQRPVSMSARCEFGARGLNTAPVLSIQISDSRDEGFEHSSSSLAQHSIHQVLTPRQGTHNPRLSQLSDNIPGFRDPELLGGGGSGTDSLENLRIDLPPDIYSSQILGTVRSPEWEPMVGEGPVGDGAFRIITETNKSTSLDNVMALEIETPPEDVLYDQAVFSTTDFKPMFDDPGYNRGLGRIPPASQTHTGDPKKPPVKYENVTIGEHMSTTRSAKKKPSYENIGAHSLEPPDKAPPPVLQGSRSPDGAHPLQQLEPSDGTPQGSEPPNGTRLLQVPEPPNRIRPPQGSESSNGTRLLQIPEPPNGTHPPQPPEGTHPPQGSEPPNGTHSPPQKSEPPEGTHPPQPPEGTRPPQGSDGTRPPQRSEPTDGTHPPQGSEPPEGTRSSPASQELEGARKPVRYENISIGTQNASRMEMRGSVDSLTLLDFQDEELEELDPDIAACL